MLTPRIFVAARLEPGQDMILEGDAFRHSILALRLAVGAPLALFNGEGGEYHGMISAIEKRRAIIRVGEFRNIEREPRIRLHLLQGVSKGERMDYTLQKAVEIGIAKITPVICERSVVRLNDERMAKKQLHWQGVIQSACEQSGRNTLPALHQTCDLPAALAGLSKSGTRLLLDPEAAVGISSVAPPPAREAVLLAGPEGGLSENEHDLAMAAGFAGLRLGARVLRTETAAVVAAAALFSRWGEYD